MEMRQAARSLYGERTSSGISSAASGAMSAVGAVYSLVSAEAATDGSLPLEDAAPLPPPLKLDISVSVSVVSEGKDLPAQASNECPGPVLGAQEPTLISFHEKITVASAGKKCVASVHARELRDLLLFFTGAAIMLYQDAAVENEDVARQAIGSTSPKAVPAWLQALRAENRAGKVQRGISYVLSSMHLGTCFCGWRVDAAFTAHAALECFPAEDRTHASH